MKGPLLSILTPTYQCGGFIRRTWSCLRDQDFTDWEWVVVDDGSGAVVDPGFPRDGSLPCDGSLSSDGVVVVP